MNLIYKYEINHFIYYIVSFYLQTLLGPISFLTKLTGKFLLCGGGSIRLGRSSLSFLVSSENIHDTGEHGTGNDSFIFSKYNFHTN